MTVSKYDIGVAQFEGHGSLHLYVHIFLIQMQEEHLDIITSIITQLSLKEGLKEWVNKYHDAVQTDMKQLYFRNTFKSMHWKELDKNQINSVLESHMLLNKTRDDKIKGRRAKDGNKHRDYILNDYSSYPTLLT